MDKLLMTIKETAKLLSLHPSAIYALTYRGVLPFVRLGGRKMLRLKDVEALIDDNLHGGGNQ